MLVWAAAHAAGGWCGPSGKDELIVRMDLIVFVQLSLEPLFRANSTQRLRRFMFGVAANLLIRLEG